MQPVSPCDHTQIWGRSLWRLLKEVYRVQHTVAHLNCAFFLVAFICCHGFRAPKICFDSTLLLTVEVLAQELLKPCSFKKQSCRKLTFHRTTISYSSSLPSIFQRFTLLLSSLLTNQVFRGVVDIKKRTEAPESGV